MKYLFLLLLALLPLHVLAEDTSDEDAAVSSRLFAGDLEMSFGEDGPFKTIPDVYLTADEIPKKAQPALQVLKEGMTYAECKKKGWAWNFWSLNVYTFGCALPGRTVYAEVAVRMFWRPAAMPKSVYDDPKAREDWLREHHPSQKPTDILMKFSRPFAFTPKNT